MTIYHQSTFDHWPFFDQSVQAIITSPPYWSLRRYDIPDIDINGWTGQYGAEPDFHLYIEHTMLWLQEAWRVLRDDGILFINIADTYYSGSTPGWQGKQLYLGDMPGQAKIAGYRRKSLCAIPERLTIAMIDSWWIFRNRIVWHKNNCLPESVKDRFSRRHEHILMFTKSSRYNFHLDPIRVKFKYPERKYNQKTDHHKSNLLDNRITQGLHDGRKHYGDPSKGKNPGDVWSINNQPRKDHHFAMFPDKLVERLILCSTEPGDIVLDPFVGSGTTVDVAEKLGRIGHGIDLGYKEIQE